MTQLSTQVSTQLSEHFALDEFCRSDTAARKGIDNGLPLALLANARETAAMLERIRARLGVPLVVTSGYRCPALNAAVGSRPGSDHEKAACADIRAPGFGTPLQVCQALAPEVDALGIGQLINEFPDRDGWVHVSFLRPASAVNRVLTISGLGTRVGIHS